MAAKEAKVWENSVFGNIKIPISLGFDDGFKGVDKNVVWLATPCGEIQGGQGAKDKTEAPST